MDKEKQFPCESETSAGQGHLDALCLAQQSLGKRAALVAHVSLQTSVWNNKYLV